jgi:poly(hydroxyalkanoate) depolymerase family esterase
MAHRTYIAFLIVVATLLGAAGLRPAVTSAATPPGKVLRSTYTGIGGSLPYETYVPSTYVRGTPVPLIVALHGCTQSAAKFRQLTRFDALAEAQRLIVVFPEQSSNANRLNCWNFFENEHMKRGAGEPAMIAGITQRVRAQYTIDPHRIYAAGLSAGGAMASIMSATYPDVFAASGIGSGCEYAAGAACAGYRGVDPEQAGRQAYDAMGSRARMMPVIIFQGDKDKTVPPANAQQLIQQWQATGDLADNGARDHSVPTAPIDTAAGRVPAGRSYKVANYSDGHGRELIQYWEVQGMAHAWSGGCACEAFADPTGPNETAAMYAFFMSHPAP